MRGGYERVMTGAGTRTGTVSGRIALALLTLALLLRVLVPAGFMPAAGEGFAITLCTGAGAMPAWVDEHGQVHKGEQNPDKQIEHPCAFAGLSAGLDLPSFPGGLILSWVARSVLPAALDITVAIGRGLAAPPPPSTGPPPSL